MQTWRSRRFSSMNSRPPGWQTVSSRSPKNTSRTCGLTDCGLAGGALAAGTLAAGTLAAGTLAGGALAGGALAGLEAGTLAAPPAAEENKPASVESGLERARSGGAGVAPRPVLATHALPEHPAGRHPRSRVRPPRRRARARTRPRGDRGREASPAVT